jgi:hypothetical protein
MMQDASVVVVWTLRLVAWSVALQTVELLQLRSTAGPRGIWRLAWLANDYQDFPAPLRLALTSLLSYRAFVALLCLQLTAALYTLVTATDDCIGFLFVSTMLVCVRFRGTFNGGSDYMTALVLLALTVNAATGNAGFPRAACLGYVALQAMFSYFIAGLVKLKEPLWRSGVALTSFVTTGHYAVSPQWQQSLANPRLSRVASATVIAFECAFPLALLSPSACVVLLGLALMFHLVNAQLFGLNRFVWAWLAAYPAVLHVSQLVSALLQPS